MGVLDRLSTLLRANINDMLDQAEDPEVMLNQILRDMQDEIGKARTQVASMMAQEKIFQGDLQDAQNQSQHMEQRAEQYVTQGNDAMAREALKRKADADANIQVLQQQLSAQTEMVQRLRSQLDALNDKYQQAYNSRDTLLARYHRAQAQQQITGTMQSLNVHDYSSDLSRMEQRIQLKEATSDAQSELQSEGDNNLSSQFDTDDRNAQVDSQLAALKARMGVGGSTGGGSGSSSGAGSTGSTAPGANIPTYSTDTSEPGSIDGGPDTRRIGMAQGGQ